MWLMPNVTLVHDNPRAALVQDNPCEARVQDNLHEALVTPSTAVQVSLLTGPPGPMGSVTNSIPREWSYAGGQLTFPFTAGGVSTGAVTPQLYGMTYTDATGARWACPPGGTAWVAVATITQGQTQ